MYGVHFSDAHEHFSLFTYNSTKNYIILPGLEGLLHGQIYHRKNYYPSSEGDLSVDTGCYQGSVKCSPLDHQ